MKTKLSLLSGCLFNSNFALQKVMVEFEILLYNTRAVGDEAKRKKIFNYIKGNTSCKSINFPQISLSPNNLDENSEYNVAI